MTEDHRSGTSLYRPSWLTNKSTWPCRGGDPLSGAYLHGFRKKSGILVAAGHSLLRAVFHWGRHLCCSHLTGQKQKTGLRDAMFTDQTTGFFFPFSPPHPFLYLKKIDIKKITEAFLYSFTRDETSVMLKSSLSAPHILAQGEWRKAHGISLQFHQVLSSLRLVPKMFCAVAALQPPCCMGVAKMPSCPLRQTQRQWSG